MNQPPHKALALFPTDEQGLRFLSARGKAIESYVGYEQSLANLYASLMGVSQDYAGVTFFRINNARARLEIMERLLRKRHGDQYNLFWTSLKKQLGGLDARRNEIVHWTSFEEIGAVRTLTLAPGNFWDQLDNPNRAKIVVDDLYDFIIKAHFFSRLLNMFLMVCSGQLAKYKEGIETLARWSPIFEEAVVYPPPEGHPLL
jgi:hypothetical protein